MKSEDRNEYIGYLKTTGKHEAGFDAYIGYLKTTGKHEAGFDAYRYYLASR